MFNKHFIKTMLLFSMIILMGLVGVMVANSFEGSGNDTQSPASIICSFRANC